MSPQEAAANPPGIETDVRAVFDLPLSVGAAAAARRSAREVFRAWRVGDEDWLHQTTLVVSELVSNAVRHGGERLSLELALEPERAVVAVNDGSAVLPERRDADPDAEGGRGLAIVEALSLSWGVQRRDGGGKRVWVELPLPGDPWPRQAQGMPPDPLGDARGSA